VARCGGRQHRVGAVGAAADADDHVAAHGLDAQNGAGQDLVLLRGEGVEHHAALGLADALDDDLLGGLGGNAAESLRFDIHVHEVAQLGMLVNLLRGVERDLGRGRKHILDDLFLDIHLHVVVLDLDEHVVGIAVLVLFIGRDESLRDLVDHIGLRDAPFLFQLRQRGENFCVHV